MTTAPAFEQLELVEHDGTVTVRIRWPEPVGGLTTTLITDLERLLGYLEDTANATTVVFRGLDRPSTQGTWELPNIDHCRRWEKLLVRIDRLAAASIAVIESACVRFCAQLAIACDLRVAAQPAVFHMPELLEGYLPGMSTFRLTKFIGLGVARRIIFLGQEVTAQDAYGLGLVDVLAPAEQLESEVARVSQQLAALDRSAVQMIRRLLNESFSTSFEDAIGQFVAAQNSCLDRRRG